MSENATPPVLGELLTALAMGGAENLAVQIANTHVRAGGQAHLIVLSGPGPLSGRVDPGVILHYLDYSRESIRNPFRFLVSVVQGYRLLSRVIADNQVEVLQTHLPDANLWGLVLAFFNKCRVFVTIHNNVFFGDKKRFGIKRWLLESAYRLMFRKCDGVVACSEEVKRSILEGLGDESALRERVHVVTNGVQPPGSLDEKSRVEIRTQWNIQDDEFFVVAAGRFTEAKNFACLVDSVAMLAEQGHSLKLVVGGEGPLRPAVMAQVEKLALEDRIRIPGNIPDLLGLMQAADCLALSSRWEGLPLVLLEGMIRGLPIVGTRIKGISETISDGVHGFLVDPDDPDAMAGAFAKLMDDPVSARKMGRAGQELVEEKFSFTRVYRELMEIFFDSTESG